MAEKVWIPVNLIVAAAAVVLFVRGQDLGAATTSSPARVSVVDGEIGATVSLYDVASGRVVRERSFSRPPDSHAGARGVPILRGGRAPGSATTRGRAVQPPAAYPHPGIDAERQVRLPLPAETAQRPFFEHLGAPAADRRLTPSGAASNFRAGSNFPGRKAFPVEAGAIQVAAGASA